MNDRNIHTYYEDDDLKVSMETLEGHLFVHLEADKITSNNIKKLRLGFDKFLKEAHDRGFSLVHAAGDNPQSIRMWAMVKPYRQIDVVPENPHVSVACWDTEVT